MTSCIACAAAFAFPVMSAASFSVDGGSQPKASSMPRLDRVLTAAARAALATRRRGAVMSPETRAKISETARRNRAARAAMVQRSMSASKRTRKRPDVETDGSSPAEEETTVERRGGRKGSKMSEERKRKISEAMKGRAKSAEHKKKLSERFKGENNPMYGRKVSDKTRAKISRAVSASRAAKKAERDLVEADDFDGEGSEEELLPVTPELQEKVLRSRLISSLSAPEKTDEEAGEEAALDDLLARVAAGKLPPDSVKRMRLGVQDKAAQAEVDVLEKVAFTSAGEAAGEVKSAEDSSETGTRKGNPARKRSAKAPSAVVAAPRPMHGKLVRKLPTSKKASALRGKKGKAAQAFAKCSTCLGSGTVVCGQCVGRIGIASKFCSSCEGAAVTFCPRCLGSGEEQPAAS